jgi:hypothetical protein
MKLRRLLLPQLSWAFPRGQHHLLIAAAISSDREASLAAAHRWLNENDIDDAIFRDHRLLLAVAARFGTELKQHAAYPRLVGLQRMLWTRSMMARQEASPCLARIAAAGHSMMLIKGAAQLAARSLAGKQRVAYDIDVVVKPEAMTPVFQILCDEGWTPSPGTTGQYIREHLASIRGLNLFKGDWGDIDLHSRPYHPGQGGTREDARFWAAARPASLNGTELLVPQPEDRIALAIAHGGLDGHTHSDWLVDCATILREESFDWHLLGEIVAARGIEVPAAVTFHYFQEQLGFQIPPEFLRKVTANANRQGWGFYAGLIQVRPKEQSGPIGQLMRAMAKKYRMISGNRHMPTKAKDRLLAVRRVAAKKESNASSFGQVYRLDLPENHCNRSDLKVDIVLDLQPTASKRRIEMEICSSEAHLCRIRYRKWNSRQEPIRLHISGTVPNPSAGSELELISRPSRQLRRHASEPERARYEPLAFRVVSCQVS